MKMGTMWFVEVQMDLDKKDSVYGFLLTKDKSDLNLATAFLENVTKKAGCLLTLSLLV